MRIPAVMAGVGFLLTAQVPAAEGYRSLADLDIEFTEAKMTLQSVSEDNEVLRHKLAMLQQTVNSLTESLAIANSEAEVFKRESAELRMRLEALGLDGAATDESKLQQRLLKAVSDLRLAKEERDKLADQLKALALVLQGLWQSVESTDPRLRTDVETQLRAANEALGVALPESVEATAVPASLTDAMVVDVKEELSLVVANIGKRQGVKPGMPFQVWREDQRVGIVRVVDVREKIAGAVIQNLVSETDRIKVGDRLRVDAK